MTIAAPRGGTGAAHILANHNVRIRLPDNRRSGRRALIRRRILTRAAVAARLQVVLLRCRLTRIHVLLGWHNFGLENNKGNFDVKCKVLYEGGII